MFPIPGNRRLPFSLIADYWSREAQPAATKHETITELIQAWWRGELVGKNGPRRLEMLRALFGTRQDCIAFMAPGVEMPPQIESTDDGGHLIIRPLAVPLPNFEPDTWDDGNCARAYETLAEGWYWLEDDDVVVPIICSTELTRAEFFEWLNKRGNWFPTFWGDASAGTQSASKTSGQLMVEQQERAADQPEGALARKAVSTRAFNRAWRAAIEKSGRRDWSAPGRKS